MLIDDKPVMKGALEPVWEHLLFDRPFNREITDKRRLTRDNGERILLGNG